MHTSRRGLFLLCVCVLGRTLLAGLKCPTPIVFTNFCFGAFGNNNNQIMKKLLLLVKREIKTGRIYLILMLLFFLLLFINRNFSSKNESKDNKITKTSTIEKTPWELEDESIKKGEYGDTTLAGFVFGMKKDQVEKLCKKLARNNIILPLKNDKYCYFIDTKNFRTPFELSFFYDNEGNLFRVKGDVILNSIKKNKESNQITTAKEEVLQKYKTDIKEPSLTNGTQPNATLYWLCGKVRIDYLDNEKGWCYSYSNIIAERKMIAFNEELEKKRIEEKNSKEQEDILQKERLANLQIQEEENIIKKLKTKAKKNWPDDYTTQEFWINEQIEAYHYMLTISNSDRIKKKAQRDWPLDFLTQKFWYNEQIEAKHRLE